MTTINDLKAKLKKLTSKWFYTKEEIDSIIDSIVNQIKYNVLPRNLDYENRNKNVVTDSYGNVTTEAKPVIPSASTTTPSADTTNGGIGTGTTWAKADHSHPKSSLYADANHYHDSLISSYGITIAHDNGEQLNLLNDKIIYDHEDTDKVYYDKSGNWIHSGNEIATMNDVNEKADNSDFDTVTATVTYTDNTTETVTFYVEPSS